MFVQRGKGTRTAKALAEVVQAEENLWPEDQVELQIRNYPESVPKQLRESVSRPPPPIPTTLQQNQPPMSPQHQPEVVIHSVEEDTPSEGSGEKLTETVQPLGSPRISLTKGDEAEDLYGATPPPIVLKKEFSFTPGRDPLSNLHPWRLNDHALPNPTPTPAIHPRDGSLPPFEVPRTTGPHTEPIRPL